jgi:peptide/nickel transport system substrate-binding protein
MYKRNWFMILMIPLLAILTACSNQIALPTETAATTVPETAATAVPETANTAAETVMRIGWAGSPDALNPGTAILVYAATIFQLVYDTMYQLEFDGSFTPELAESIDVSADGTVWTFKIRSGVTWHDGAPLTAQDVAFSYNLYKEREDFHFLNAYTLFFDTIEAPDDNTVVITLTEPIPNMESQLISLPVLPQHIWGQLEGDGVAEFENLEMIGSGPFRLTEYRPNQFVRLEATGNHFLYSPKINAVVFQTFDNQDTLVQALRTGQIDMITEMPNTAVAALRNEPNIGVVAGAPLLSSVVDIIINQTTPEDCPPDDGVCSSHPALLDRNVRLALAHATDKQQIIDVVLLGLGKPGLTLIPDSLGDFYNDSLVDYTFDVDLANQILEEAGYLDSNGDGVREMPDSSNPLIFRVNWPSDSVDAPRMAELLSGMWSQIGVGTELQALDPDALTAICCPTFDFDIILWSWFSDPDPGFLLSVMLTNQIPTGNSETGYSDAGYDELYDQQAVEMNRNRRIELVWEMQRIVHEDIVYIIPYYSQAVQAYRTDRFTGWLITEEKVALEDLRSLLAVEPIQ